LDGVRDGRNQVSRTRPAVTLKSAVKAMLDEARDKEQFALAEIGTWNRDANLSLTLTVEEVSVLAKAPKILEALKYLCADIEINDGEVPAYAKRLIEKSSDVAGSNREPFTEAVDDLPELLQALTEGHQIQAKHIRDDQWVYVEDWEPGVDFENYKYRRVS
jgi:hypothetical protein